MALPVVVTNLICCAIPPQNGLFCFDTINRTLASAVITIGVAQELTSIVPKNTHDWQMFIKPYELTNLAGTHGFYAPTKWRGLVPATPLPLLGLRIVSGKSLGKFKISASDLSTSYFGYCVKK
jgi:2-polyprenyl-6-hydroxyphenyl methylase / 3-demethylubiquinone-9 3-methyltransferase